MTAGKRLPMIDPKQAIPDPSEPAPVQAVQLSPDYRELLDADLDTLFDLARNIIADPTLPTVRAWTATGRKAIACFPVYTPHEIAHAMGLLPVTLHGGGENVEITRADAPLGSFLCSISKTTLEMGLQGDLDPFSAYVFPYICDVSRNLEGVFSRRFPDKGTHMLHLPQNFTSKATIPFLVTEYGRLIKGLEAWTGKKFTKEALTETLAVFQAQRDALERLRSLKADRPWQVTLEESYLLRRLGTLLPREVHIALVNQAVDALGRRQCKARDSIRIVLVGPFCEQPTLETLRLIEEVGCYVVDDPMMLRDRWHPRVDVTDDPLEALARAYVETPVDVGVRQTPTTKADAIRQRVRDSKADGIVFLSAKFCEPALEDVVLYERALDADGVPSLHLEFEERSTGYDHARLAIETFVESILFDEK